MTYLHTSWVKERLLVQYYQDPEHLPQVLHDVDEYEQVVVHHQPLSIHPMDVEVEQVSCILWQAVVHEYPTSVNLYLTLTKRYIHVPTFPQTQIHRQTGIDRQTQTDTDRQTDRHRHR